MARKPRIQFAGGTYHIISRGNEKKDIYYDEWDYKLFTSKLYKLSSLLEINVFCYCLMKNHFHLLIQTKHPNLSIFMKGLLGYYATYFNKRHNRSGHLFQNRYKSFIVDNDNYLVQLSRYIHLNPARAGFNKPPEEYKWSSMQYYLNTDKRQDFIKQDLIMNYFKNKESYYSFIINGDVSRPVPIA